MHKKGFRAQHCPPVEVTAVTVSSACIETAEYYIWSKRCLDDTLK